MSGLRERKKQHTHEAIATAAARLFAERGFAAVTVDDVAEAAEVSRQTVFNYFPTKEAMVFDRDAEIEDELIALVRERPAGTPLTVAFHEHTCAFWRRLQGVLAEGPLPHGFWEIVTTTPALRDYAEVMGARHARHVAAELAAQRGLPADDPVCHGLARALCGANSAIWAYGFDRLLAGEDPSIVVTAALAKADELYDLLAHGLDAPRI